MRDLAAEFDAIPVPEISVTGKRNYAYSEGPTPGVDYSSMPRIEISGVPQNSSRDLAAEFDKIPIPNQNIPDLNNKYSNEVNGVADRFKDLLYGGAMGAAGFVETPAQIALNFGANISGNEYLKNKANEFNQFLTNQENQYQEETPGSIAAGTGRFGASIAPFLLNQSSGAASLAQNTPKIIQYLKSAGQGALFPLISDPIINANTDNFSNKLGIKSGVGAAFGIGGKALGSALSKSINPLVSDDVKKLMSEGITPTLGQILGGGFKRTEEKLSSVPILGDLIKNSQRRAVEDLNKAIYQRALSPINESTSTKIGRESIEGVSDKLSDAYNEVLPKLTFKYDEPFEKGFSELQNKINNGNLPPEISNQFNNIVKNEFFSRVNKNNEINGEELKKLDSLLNSKIKNFGGSDNPNHRDISENLSELQKLIKDNLRSNNQQYASRLDDIDRAYANYAILRNAGSKLGAEEGIISPAQLQNAVRGQDRSVQKGNFAKGNAFMQDLSDAAKNTLSQTYPDSGTPGRALLAAIPTALTTAYFNPGLGAALGATGTMMAAPYTQIGQKLIASLLTKRPESAPKIANAVNSLISKGSIVISPKLLSVLQSPNKMNEFTP